MVQSKHQIGSLCSPASSTPERAAISVASANGGELTMKRPEDVTLSREEGEALLARLEANTLTADDRRVLGKVLASYFWLLLALREAKLSLKRIKALVFGEKPKPPKPPSSEGPPIGGSAGGGETPTSASQ